MGNLKVSTIFLVLAVAVSIVHSAPQPQFITFKDGRLGVNFGGYHAGVGIGGSVDGGPAGGLFAEAGTPQGQSARAGLGGSVDPEHGPVGGLYAGATAGGNVGAHAGLGGSVNGGKPIGQGFAEAEAGDRFASAGLGGETSAVGATGYKIKTKEIIRPTVHKKVHKEIILDSVNEVNPHIETEVKPEVHTPVIEKEVHVEKTPAPVVYEKHVVRYKPHHHFRKTAYVGGYVGGAAPEVQEIHKTVHAPVIQKRIDIEHDSVPHSANVGYNKQIVFQRNPTFFSDIFNIPIQTLKAVGSFLGNTAASTSVSVQKSASVQAGAHY